MNYSKSILIGRLTKDPESSTVGNGTVMTKFDIASNYYKGKDQDQGVSYFSCIAWAKQGEAIATHFIKGDPIFIDAEARQERWESNEGQSRSKVVFHVREFQFLKSKGQQTETPVGNNPDSMFNDDEIPI